MSELELNLKPIRILGVTFDLTGSKYEQFRSVTTLWSRMTGVFFIIVLVGLVLLSALAYLGVMSWRTDQAGDKDIGMILASLSAFIILVVLIGLGYSFSQASINYHLYRDSVQNSLALGEHKRQTSAPASLEQKSASTLETKRSEVKVRREVKSGAVRQLEKLLKRPELYPGDHDYLRQQLRREKTSR